MYLPALLKAAAAADLVIGSRYVPGAGIRDWPLRRLLLSTFANRYVQAVARLGVRDCTSGFRCWRSGLLARIPLQQIRSEGYAFQVEMVFNAHAAGARIVEVPIVFVERRAGASKLSRRVMLESAVLPWRLLMRRRRD
jgi:dolichol-phosphate mannosyltransferase